ncbi:two-component system, NtrC family, response regulator [Desulfocicer vacuolatum DSM 3385]|uniref:Two-component system, NtrC family, response regulator n=1 Tax=Desulfocicer vacuolatum DSM 3385 TaxID=1121400 RepID=A0A1W1ZUG9_9BACT|nr:sigma-54 dependent transcriptional regulator [Desulfocicer vacuolatum]SMC52047.1 two-component system, NtrC family, response regulator [Desulfocicer vacuolatum DSM 3385]
MDKVLIVDDEKNYPTILGEVIKEEGFEPVTASSGLIALDILRSEPIDLVLTDVMMPGMDGIELLARIKELNPGLPVMVMTAHGSVERAVEAMQKGAFTYILKPFDNETLVAHMQKAIAIHEIVKENSRLKEEISILYNFDNIIGKSKPMEDLYNVIRKVAPTGASILIEGESGTGKELAARSIHYNSPRKDHPLVAVNCSAFAESLLESELFGHEKGAFTGAANMKKGRFELAHKGTIFLDEIGELPSAIQVKLLRVLQEKTIERVGGTQSFKVDFRLIAATNKNLEKEVEKGHFREDLYYRLNVVKAVMPPLRERDGDIPLLVNHFIHKYAHERKIQQPLNGVDPRAARVIFEYSWPGNVRELENVIERAVILATGTTISVEDLPMKLQSSASSRPSMPLEGIPENAGLTETLAAVEKRMIKRAMALSGNVQTKAAKILGIGKSGLNQKIKKYGL